jgi:D-glycero-D-manno-heptose 1,7-bisphosphate phosphatase
MRASAFAGRFIDIGVPDDLARAQQGLASWLHRPAVFLDRDGTLNIDSGYVHKERDFQWLPGAIEAVGMLNDAGAYVFVVTNQAGVAHGLYDETDVVSLHQWMQSELRNHAAHVDDIRFCPYHSDAQIETYRREDFWRKPKPGMLVDLMQHWPVDVSRSVIIGDKCSDVEAGAALGIRGIKLNEESLACVVRRYLETAAGTDGQLLRSEAELPV